MSNATEIMYSAINAHAAIAAAEAFANVVDQDWEAEATLYTFNDDSVLVLSGTVVSGPQLNAYSNITAARRALTAARDALSA